MDRTGNSVQASRLARMKAVAFGLLAAAAVLYAVATHFIPRHPAWGYVAAFAEAAMVGAMADWFAVVALFRRPLGLPIPHTAIIPTNKARLARNLADFFCLHFLGTPQVLAKLVALDPASLLARWLSRPANATAFGRHAISAARYALGAFDDSRVREFIRETATSKLQQLDVSALLGQILDVLTADRRHQVLLDRLLHEAGEMLEGEALRTRLAEMVAAEVEYLRYLRLDKVAGKLVTGKIIASLGRLVTEMGDGPEHPLRLRFDDYMAEFIARLRTDPALRDKGAEIRDAALAHPALAAYLQDLWGQLLGWLQEDLARPESTIARRLTELAATLGQKLEADAEVRQWLNDQVLAAAPALIDRYREDIRDYIVARVDSWDADELTRELELLIGRDLQFVRVNGTLVGGLIGVLIHAITAWLA